jgi:hypothetical protein
MNHSEWTDSFNKDSRFNLLLKNAMQICVNSKSIRTKKGAVT